MKTLFLKGTLFSVLLFVSLQSISCGGGGGDSPPPPSPSPPPWTKQWGTTKADEATGIAVDGSDNIYVTGYTLGNLDGNTNAGGYDAFLTKFDTSGAKQWTKLLGHQGGGANAAGNDKATGVAVDSSGNIYVTGYTTGNLDGNTNAGGYDAFLAKYESSGTWQWTRLLGHNGGSANAAGNDLAIGVAVDGSGNIYVTGGTTGNLDGETNAGGYDAFLAKYDSTGTWKWTRLLGHHGGGANAAGDEEAYGIAVDGSGNIYVAGYTTGNLDGEINAGGYDAFLAMYDPTGAWQWTKLLGTAGDDYANGVAVDVSGYIYVTGPTSGALDGETNAGGYDAFLAKYDSSGNKQWTKLLGTAAPDDATGVAVDGSGNIYVTGSTDGNLNGNTNAGPSDVFLARYDSLGGRLWTKLLGSSSGDYPLGIAVGGGYIYVTGLTSGNLDGNTNAGDTDIFLVKYSPGGVKQ